MFVQDNNEEKNTPISPKFSVWDAHSIDDTDESDEDEDENDNDDENDDDVDNDRSGEDDDSNKNTANNPPPLTNKEENDDENPIAIFSKELLDKGVLEIDNVEQIRTTEDLFKAVTDTVEKQKTKLIESFDPYVQKLNAFIEAGGNAEDFLKKGYTDYANYDIEDSGTQLAFIERRLQAQGLSNEDIKEELEMIIASGKQRAKAEKARDFLINVQKQRLDEEVANQRKVKEQIEAFNTELVNNVNKQLKQMPTVLGTKITAKEAAELNDFIFKVDKKTNKTAFQRYFEEGNAEERAAKLINSAYIALKKGNPETTIKKLETVAMSKLEQSLANKAKTVKSDNDKKVRYKLDN